MNQSANSMDCRTQLASLASEELDKGDFLMATKILTTGIRLDPNNHELYFERSICHHKLGDFKSSLDDANTAIRLNSSDYNIHYQKGLALIGLSMFPEAVSSFKKAIELRAKQDDSRLSDIFKLLRDASKELDTARARRRPGFTNNHQARNAESLPTTANPATTIQNAGLRIATSNDPVDSTTDRPLIQPGTSTSSPSNHQNMTSSSSTPSVDIAMKNGNNNLVAANRNNNINNNIQTNSNSSKVVNGNNITITNRVSSSASHINNNNLHMPSISVSPDMFRSNIDATPTIGSADLMRGNQSHQHIDQSKDALQFEWNIRRSERIFLHHSSEPGTASGSQYGILTRHTETPGSIGSQRQKTGSNPSSVHSVRSSTKRPHENSETLQQAAYLQANVARSKDGTGSHAESDIDVDDSNHKSQTTVASNTSDASDHKRVMIAPSSSMPATSQQGPSTSTTKDDSYSSKYKRLRRDRERARRGTSKLCTIRPSDLDELYKSPNLDGRKRHMRVIAPIDGWLYSGQLSVDDNSGKNGAHQYVVKLDGDATGSSYLFSQDTVLNDVIKEVRVKSVSELRKGARICCYWSRQYKCLSTGVVTSRTFEATKSLVSVKYDNGDLSALPLDDLRLLPPDYPKYMSNCDPLLLARNGDGVHVTTAMPTLSQNSSNRIIVECKQSDVRPTNGLAIKSDANETFQSGMDVSNELPAHVATSDDITEVTTESSDTTKVEASMVVEENQVARAEVEEGEDEDATIPPTDEVIDFITSEGTLKLQDGNHQVDSANCVERISITKDNITTMSETAKLNTSNSRASSEENNYGIEYCPWMFDGPPKRTKRHGRTYRDNYPRIRRGNETIRVGDSAELMPRDESILPFIARIEGLWSTSRGEMRVKVRWYYRLVETEGEPLELKDGENALFETDHFDENDVQSIYRSTKILPWTDYCKNNLGHVNKNNDNTPKIFYLAGYYDPVRRIKHLRSDVKEAQ